eukprot:6180472-Pleurochrysis_carterae.AAC.2
MLRLNSYVQILAGAGPEMCSMNVPNEAIYQWPRHAPRSVWRVASSCSTSSRGEGIYPLVFSGEHPQRHHRKPRQEGYVYFFFLPVSSGGMSALETTVVTLPSMTA